MEYIYGTTNIAQDEPCVVVLGNFDGIHRGHQRLFECAKEYANRSHLKTVVFSFYPHPTWVIGNHPKPLLMSRRDKKEMAKRLKIDMLIEYPFTKEFATISPKEFFIEILVKSLCAKSIVIGSNYYFGKNQSGSPTYLRELGKSYGVEVCIVEDVKHNGEMISSSTIRKYILEGEIEKANSMLGHPYMIVGNVVQGKKLGRTIGFPTINLIADPDRIYPPNGVYATKVTVYNKEYMGMTNIGYNPTVNSACKMIETYIFEFNEDIYNQPVEIKFYRHIRRERKFESIDALRRQIEQDEKTVKQFFKSC